MSPITSHIATIAPARWVPWALFLLCLLHRSIQLWVSWPQLSRHLVNVDQLMQLIPAAVWRENFTSGWLFLQQAPPLPNLVYGSLAWLFADKADLTLAILVLQILLAGITIAVFSSLLFRLRLPAWACFLLPLVLFLSSDLIMMEYHSNGHFYYEQATMLLCLLATHSALTYLNSRQLRTLLLLGLWIALLVLTRSTFSYFPLVAAIWVLWVSVSQRPRRLAVFFLPILLLQGAWALKNYIVYDYFTIASSSWGGANARTGDIRRGGGEDVHRWMDSQEPFCEETWWQMARQYKLPIFFFPNKQLMLEYPQPEAVLEANQRAARERGELVFYDTATLRMYSQCLQRVYVRYWLAHPRQTLDNVWGSYQLFWLPIREFAARHPNNLLQPSIQEGNWPDLSAWARFALSEFSGGGYQLGYLDMTNLPKFFSYEDATVLALPAFPLLMQALNLLLVHGLLVFAAAYFVVRRGLPVGEVWCQLSFPLLCIFYVAVMTSLVEYGENMRFRMEVEPLIWAVAAVVLREFYLWLCRVVEGRHRPPGASS